MNQPMDTINPAITDPYRDQLIALGISLNPTHWVTLNLHRDATLEYAGRALKRWRVEILRRLVGRNFHKFPTTDLIEFMGCPEFSLAGHPHFHLVCRVPEQVVPDFERIATARWKYIVPSGTCHIALIEQQPNSVETIMNYATKNLDKTSSLPFVHSRLLH